MVAVRYFYHYYSFPPKNIKFQFNKNNLYSFKLYSKFSIIIKKNNYFKKPAKSKNNAKFEIFSKK